MRPVTEDALFKRCKRHLKRTEGLYLHRCPERSRSYQELGRYYMLTGDNVIHTWGFQFG